MFSQKCLAKAALLRIDTNSTVHWRHYWDYEWNIDYRFLSASVFCFNLIKQMWGKWLPFEFVFPFLLSVSRHHVCEICEKSFLSDASSYYINIYNKALLPAQYYGILREPLPKVSSRAKMPFSLHKSINFISHFLGFQSATTSDNFQTHLHYRKSHGSCHEKQSMKPLCIFYGANYFPLFTPGKADQVWSVSTWADLSD